MTPYQDGVEMLDDDSLWLGCRWIQSNDGIGLESKTECSDETQDVTEYLWVCRALQDRSTEKQVERNDDFYPI